MNIFKLSVREMDDRGAPKYFNTHDPSHRSAVSGAPPCQTQISRASSQHWTGSVWGAGKQPTESRTMFDSW